MRVFICACTLFNTGLPSIVDAIDLPAFLKPVQSPL
jgi:hypothetical protein